MPYFWQTFFNACFVPCVRDTVNTVRKQEANQGERYEAHLPGQRSLSLVHKEHLQTSKKEISLQEKWAKDA